MSKQDTAVIAKVVQEYGKDPHRLMDIVRGVHEQAGYLSDDAVDEIAKALGVDRVQVADMASFYTFFDREPAGKCTIRLSNCVVDQMHGMEAVAKAFEKELGIAFGETTPDGTITPLDGYLDPYFQEVYLEAESIPVFTVDGVRHAAWAYLYLGDVAGHQRIGALWPEPRG